MKRPRAQSQLPHSRLDQGVARLVQLAIDPDLARMLAIRDGEHLRKRRLGLGLLERKVAERIGMTGPTIWNWEANYISPQLRFIPTVIAFVGYDPNDTQSGSLGEGIVACRHSRGLSQKELAHCLGVDPGTLGKWERGGGQPAERLLLKLEDLLASQFSSASGIKVVQWGSLAQGTLEHITPQDSLGAGTAELGPRKRKLAAAAKNVVKQIVCPSWPQRQIRWALGH